MDAGKSVREAGSVLVSIRHTEVRVQQPVQRAQAIGLRAESIGKQVLAALSNKGRLRPEAARMQCLPIRRAGELCGLHFALRGPRDVLLTAVWDATTNLLWCYDSRGERFLQTQPDDASATAEK